MSADIPCFSGRTLDLVSQMHFWAKMPQNSQTVKSKQVLTDYVEDVPDEVLRVVAPHELLLLLLA